MLENKIKLDEVFEELFEENNIDIEKEETETEVEETDVDETEDEEVPEVETEDEETIEDEDEDEVDFENEEILVEEEILPKRKPTREEKERYAFEKLRKERDQERKKLEELDNIALSYGFKSHEEMLEQLRKEAYAKEAKKQNMDPKVYEEIINTKKELDNLKRKMEEENRAKAVTSFVGHLDNFVKTNNLSDDDKTKMLEKMEEDGYTLDILLKVKNPAGLFKGYVVDKLKENEVQKRLEAEERKRKLEEKKFESGGNPKATTIDDIIDSLFKSRQ